MDQFTVTNLKGEILNIGELSFLQTEPYDFNEPKMFPTLQ